MSRPDPHGLAVVLHAHIPYVMNHGRWPHGGDWLNEAVAETYLPLLGMMRRLERDAVPFALNVGITPVLCEQLSLPVFRDEFLGYLENKIAAARDNGGEFSRRGDERLAALAEEWARFYAAVREDYLDVWGGSVLDGFRHFERAGAVELLGSAATHGYLPLLGRDSAVRAQVRAGVAAHARHFGKRPRGMWLPECAYRPRQPWAAEGGSPGAAPRRGIEDFLADEGLGFFIVDTHLLGLGAPAGLSSGPPGVRPAPAGISGEADPPGASSSLLGGPRFRTGRAGGAPPPTTHGGASRARSAPRRSVHRPYLVQGTPSSPVAVFGRDPETGVVVWSGEYGYPAAGAYLEFHKKHFPGGLRYWRVTRPRSDLGEKEVYDPGEADLRIRRDAAVFSGLVEGILASSATPGARTLTAPYDAELFGHWWFEGVSWLDQVCRLAPGRPFRLVRLSDQLDADPPGARPPVPLPEGSWGYGGGHGVWFNDLTEAYWGGIHAAEARMESLAARLAAMEGSSVPAGKAVREVLQQAARELLLLEASDWEFLISSSDARDYAEGRLMRHLSDFRIMADAAEGLLRGESLPAGDREAVEALRQRDPLFPDLDPLWWAP